MAFEVQQITNTFEFGESFGQQMFIHIRNSKVVSIKTQFVLGQHVLGASEIVDMIAKGLA